MNRSYPLLSVLFFLLIAGLFFYIWQPQSQIYGETQEKLFQTQETVKRAENILANLRESENKLAEYDNIIKQLEIVLPTNSLELDLNVFLRQAIRNHGLLLNNLNIQETTDKVNINLSTKGSYRAFVGFLQFLHRNYKFFIIKDISFVAAEEATEPWTFDVKITTYRLPGSSN